MHNHVQGAVEEQDLEITRPEAFLVKLGQGGDFVAVTQRLHGMHGELVVWPCLLERLFHAVGLHEGEKGAAGANGHGVRVWAGFGMGTRFQLCGS